MRSTLAFTFAALLLTLCACASVKQSVATLANKMGIVEHVSTQAPAEAPPEYKQALAFMQDGKNQEALDTLTTYVRQNPVAPYTQSANLNIGRALENLGRNSEAAAQYRSVASATANRAPKLQAMALYRLSFCEEALGDDQQTVAVLYDLASRSQYLSSEIAKAELPARLAAAYARVGNFDRAIEEYKKAELGISQLKRATHAEQGQVPEWLPRTLFFMGSLAARNVNRHVNWSDFEASLRPLARGQSYLLEASDLAIDPWSDKASKDLISTYQDLWTAIQSAPVLSGADPLIEQRSVQKSQWTRSTLLLESIKDLRVRKSPVAKQTAQSQRVFDFLKVLERKILQLLAERPVGEGLTPESTARIRAVRGHVISPDDSLEEKFIESAKNKKLAEPKTQDDNVPVSPPEDPNL